MKEGWIKIHRKIVEWEHFRSSSAVHLFLYLIASANVSPSRIYGIDIDKGQLLTTLPIICKETGLTIKKVRYWIAIFQQGNELVTKRAGNFTIITICKYADYQYFFEGEGQSFGSQKTCQGHEIKEKDEENTSPTPSLKEEEIRKEEEKENTKRNIINDITKKELFERKKEFQLMIAPYVEKFGRTICNDFFSYWTQLDAKSGLMRFEQQKQFFVTKRLAYFKRRQNE